MSRRTPLSRPFAALCAAAGLAFALAGTVAAGPMKMMNRLEALNALQSGQVMTKRMGLGRLAEVGTMDDVPAMLSQLLDEDDMIRGIAEQAIWGVWMRANDSTVDPMFQVALDLMHQRRLGEAEAKFTEAIALKPEFAEAWHRRAETRVMTDRWDAARQDFEKAIELNPYHFGAFEGLGHCSLHLGRSDLAVEYFRRARELTPNMPDVPDALERAERLAENSRT
jgi:tetratricopeptide (TPR) repeat protein